MAFLATLEPQVTGSSICKIVEKSSVAVAVVVAVADGSQNYILILDQVFLYILASISEGLQALGGNLNYFTGAGDKLPSVTNLEGLTALFSKSREASKCS